MNGMTVAFLALILWSVWRGAVRRFAPEAGYLTAQLVHLAAAVLALAIAWQGSEWLARWVLHVPAAQVPQWMAPWLSTWRQSPGMVQLTLLILLYLILSTILKAWIRPLPAWMMRVIPRRLGNSRLFGALLGTAAGALSALTVGAVVFVLLQLFSIPSLQRLASGSAPYQTMSDALFQPWLRPLVGRALPVLSENALAPLAKNISLFAVPTGPGSETGMLVVPNEIAQLSKRITAGQTTDRAKAYALYEWEIHNITYNWKKYDDYVDHGRWDAQTPLQTLETKKGVCADFALLYADFAHASGLTVRIDEGLAGTASSYGSHAWNEVYLPQQHKWILVDTTWGSEQDAWFNVPAQQFDQTHETQRVITIYAQ